METVNGVTVISVDSGNITKKHIKLPRLVEAVDF